MKPVWLTLFLSLLAIAPVSGDEQRLSGIEGQWKLIEWHEGDVVLTPPEIGGRTSLTDGTVLFMVHNETAEGSEYVHGYGSYSVENNEYRYEYEKYVEVFVIGDDRQVSSGPVAETSYIAKPDGARLMIMDAETGTRGLVLEGDRMTWMHNGKPLRVYERVQD